MNKEAFKESPDITEELISVYQHIINTQFSRREVSAVDIGYDIDQSCKLGNKPLVRIHDRFGTFQRIPREQFLKKFLDKSIHEYVTYVSGSYNFLSPSHYNCKRHKTFSTIQPGICIGDGRLKAGTLGILASISDGYDEVKGFLTCEHVVRDSYEVTQPYGSNRVIGNPLPHKMFRNIYGDAAFIKFSDQELNFSTSFYDSGITPIHEKYARLGETLSKSGIATASTEGIVDGIGKYKIGSINLGVEGFRVVNKQPCDTKEVSDGMDSGSVFFSKKTKEAKGIVFAGERSSRLPEYALACHLPKVLERMSAKLL